MSYKVVCPRCHERIILEDGFFGPDKLAQVKICPRCAFPMRVAREEAYGNRIILNRFGRQIA